MIENSIQLQYFVEFKAFRWFNIRSDMFPLKPMKKQIYDNAYSNLSHYPDARL